jgi:N utilization substance protein A
MISFNNSELLQVIDSVAREKGINKESVIIALESAVQVAARRKYGHKHNIKAEIDRRTGEIKLFREYLIVETVENPTTEISLADAKEKDENAMLDCFVYDPLPPIDLGRVSAQAAKQTVIQKVKDAEKERQYEEYQNRIGDLMNGVVKRVEYGDVVIDFGRDEALLRRQDMIPAENYKQNDRVKIVISDVVRSNKGHQIITSRTSNKFINALFAQEVPEIYDGVIKIMSISRDPGSKAKMAVYSSDSSLDPVGSCVGVRGARVQAVTNELRGEKIDIIKWSEDPATFIINALTPATVSKIVLDEDNRKAEVVVDINNLSLAIGRRGQNVRLASKLTGWKIDVLTEDQESKKRVEEFTSNSKLFMEALDVEEVIGQLLAVEGFTTIEELASAPIETIIKIEGFDESIAAALSERANAYVNKANEVYVNQLIQLGVDNDLLENLDLTHKQFVKIAENGIKSLEDLSEMTAAEMVALLPDSKYSKENWQQVINEIKNL